MRLVTARDTTKSNLAIDPVAFGIQLTSSKKSTTKMMIISNTLSVILKKRNMAEIS